MVRLSYSAWEEVKLIAETRQCPNCLNWMGLLEQCSAEKDMNTDADKSIKEKKRFYLMYECPVCEVMLHYRSRAFEHFLRVSGYIDNNGMWIR